MKAILQLAHNKSQEIEAIRDDKLHFVQLVDSVEWTHVKPFEDKWDAKISVNAGGQSINVKFIVG